MLNKMKKTHAGFTLVELIVVIAILAILSGVAIPVYSSYITKANQAADLTLIGAVNTAFAAACTEYGFHPKDVQAAVLDGDKTITGLKTIILNPGVTPLSADASAVPASLSAGARPAQLAHYSFENFVASFLTYFKGNEATGLKYYESVNQIVFQNGKFGDPSSVKGGAALSNIVHNEDEGTTTYTFSLAGGETVDYTVSEDDIQAIQDSTFGSNMSVDELMGDVTEMVGALNQALGGGNTLRGVLTSFEINGETRTLEEWGVTAEQGTDEYLAQLSNAAVMLVAASTTDATTNNLIGALSGGEGAPTINDLMNPEYAPDGENPQGLGGLLSNMAGLYGIATAFANSDEGSEWSIDLGGGNTMNAQEYYDYVNQNIITAANTHNLNNILNALGGLTAYVYVDPNDMENSPLTESFAAYASQSVNGTTQLVNDAAGYVSAMQCIANNGEAVITSGGIADGFGSDSISAILHIILGG